MNTPKIVKYYDYIHKRWRYIEVNDEVYRYFDSLKKQRKEKRKSRQRLFEESAVAFSAIEGIEESPFCEDKRVNVIKEAEDHEFAETVWRVVGKLDKEAQAMLVDRFRKDMSELRRHCKHVRKVQKQRFADLRYALPPSSLTVHARRKVLIHGLRAEAEARLSDRTKKRFR